MILQRRKASKWTKKPKTTHGQNSTFFIIKKQLLSVNLVKQSDRRKERRKRGEGEREGKEKNSSLWTQVINKLKPIKVKWNPLDQKSPKVLLMPPGMAQYCPTRHAQSCIEQPELKICLCAVTLNKTLYNIISKSFNTIWCMTEAYLLAKLKYFLDLQIYLGFKQLVTRKIITLPNNPNSYST